jgi:hypothetical protein
MVAKPRKPVRKKPATKSGRNKPARKLVSKKASRKPVRKKPATRSVTKKAAPLGSDQAEPKSNQIEATINNWAEPTPEFRRTQAALFRRWRALGKSEEFVWETFSLKRQLGQAFEANPDPVREFFRPTFSVTLIDSQRLVSRIDAVKDEEFRRLLWRYVKYAIRYGVVLQLFRKAPYFRVREGSQGVVDDRFHVVIRDGVFEPVSPPRPDDAFAEGFESDVKATPPELERLVREGIVKVKERLIKVGNVEVKRRIRRVERVAKYVLIDDEDSFSLLRQMFYFAESPNYVTVFRYNSVPSHTLFLVGQNVSLPDVWPKLRKVVVADQRAAGTRDKRGVPTDLLKLHARLNSIIRGKGSQTERAAKFVPADDPKADPKAGKQAREYPKRLAIMESQLSQLKRRLEK